MNEVIKYELNDAQIQYMNELYLAMKVAGEDDKEGAAVVHEARMVVKAARVAVEKRRKELKEGALAWGRKVDKEAKRLTGLLTPIEAHLETQEKIVTEAEARREAERQAKEREELLARERAAREAEEAARREADRLAEQVERERAERARLELELEKAKREVEPPEPVKAYPVDDPGKIIVQAPRDERAALVNYANELLAVPQPSGLSGEYEAALQRAGERLYSICEELLTI